VRTIDDLDGSVIEGGDSTVTFSFDGHTYEIDLSTPNRDKFRSALEPFIEAGRRVGGRPVAGAKPRRSRSTSSSSRGDVRDWARRNGYDVGDRGRVPSDIMAAYEKDH